MSKFFNSNENYIDTVDEKKVLSVTYQEYGRSMSVENMGTLVCYLEHLTTIFSGHVISQQDSVKQNTDLSRPLLDQISEHESDIEDFNHKKRELIPDQIASKSKQIEDEEEDLAKLENTDPEVHLRRNGKRLFNKFKFNSTIFFIGILTLTILYFYANVAWVIWSLPNVMTDNMAYSGCSPNVFNSLSDLLGIDGCGTMAGVPSIMLPMLFLTFAFLIHLVLSSTMKFKFIAASVIGLIVLVIDISLAVMFEMKIILMSGEHSIYEPLPTTFMGKLSHVLDTNNFILILCFGFFSYIFWSVLLYFFEDEAKLKNPFIMLNNEIRIKQEKISQLREQKNSFVAELNLIPQSIIDINSSIQKLRIKVRVAEVGGEEQLKKRISEFTNGWIQFISFQYDADQTDRDSKVSEIISERNNFLKNKSILSI